MSAHLLSTRSTAPVRRGDGRRAMNLMECSDMSLQVEIDPNKLGIHVAEQNSGVQADILYGFAARMLQLGGLEWRMQCTCVRQEWSDAQRSVISEVLRELLEES